MEVANPSKTEELLVGSKMLPEKAREYAHRFEWYQIPDALGAVDFFLGLSNEMRKPPYNTPAVVLSASTLGMLKVFSE